MRDDDWPHVPGDFEVVNPEGCVAICTLGKKIEVPGDYAIIGTCKTENIGIERVIINVISNPRIRFLILAGPEVPGHLTGSSLKAMHENGVESDTRKIIDAPGAIPYIENVPLEGIERFRMQIELIDMMNNSRADEIVEMAIGLKARDPGAFPENPIWIEFRSGPRASLVIGTSSSIQLLPEFRTSLDPFTLLVATDGASAIVSAHPTTIGIEARSLGAGMTLVGKEL